MNIIVPIVAFLILFIILFIIFSIIFKNWYNDLKLKQLIINNLTEPAAYFLSCFTSAFVYVLLCISIEPDVTVEYEYSNISNIKFKQISRFYEYVVFNINDSNNIYSKFKVLNVNEVSFRNANYNQLIIKKYKLKEKSIVNSFRLNFTESTEYTIKMRTY